MPTKYCSGPTNIGRSHGSGVLYLCPLRTEPLNNSYGKKRPANSTTYAGARFGRVGVLGRSTAAEPVPTNPASSPTVTGLTGGRMR